MSVCTFIGLIIAAIGTIIAVVSGLTTSIDKRIDEKLKDAAFLKQVAKEVRLPFIIFDEDVRYLHVSEADRFIEKIAIEADDKDNMTAVLVTGVNFLDASPLIQPLDGKIQFSDPQRVGQKGWRYRAVHHEYAALSREEGRPLVRFKLEVIP